MTWHHPAVPRGLYYLKRKEFLILGKASQKRRGGVDCWVVVSTLIWGPVHLPMWIFWQETCGTSLGATTTLPGASDLTWSHWTSPGASFLRTWRKQDGGTSCMDLTWSHLDLTWSQFPGSQEKLAWKYNYKNGGKSCQHSWLKQEQTYKQLSSWKPKMADNSYQILSPFSNST